MPGRKFNGGDYRYGFQGQEQDDEIKGEGNSVNYKYRMHDPRIGRFFAVDPLAPSYPHNSPYAFSENRVIDGVELEGLEYSYFMLSMDDGEDCQIKLVTVKTLDATMELITGHKYNPGLGSGSFIFGTDGNWHEVPEDAANASLHTLGSTNEEVMGVINSWTIRNDAYDAAIVSEALQRIGATGEAAIGLAEGLDGILNIYKGLKGFSKLSGAKNYIGLDYETFLHGNLSGGKVGKSIGGRDFDGIYAPNGKDILFEAKSGKYWDKIYSKNPDKFKSDMGSRLKIAKEKGYEYELFSNSKIPQDAKDWLTKKGIKFTETLD